MPSVLSVSIFGFLLAILPLILTPGYSFTVMTRESLAGRRHSGELVAAGTAAGIATHATLAALGLSALVMASSVAFRIVQLVGAAYLVGLGLHSLVRGGVSRQRERDQRGEPRGSRNLVISAYVGNVLNVKAAGIYLTVAPTFIASTHGSLLVAMLVLAAVHAIVQTGWLIGWSRLLLRGSSRTISDRARSLVQRAMGVVLIGLGLRQGASAVRA